MDLTKSAVAIIDDDSDILLSARLFLKKYFERIYCFSHPTDLLEAPELEDISVVLLDLNYQNGKNDGKEGLKALQDLKNDGKSIEVIVMTAYAELNLAVDAVKLGAFDFIVKPWQNEKLLVSVMNAVQKRNMRNQISQQEAVINSPIKNLDPFIGESDGIQQIRTLLSQLAPTHASIHLKGESGTGKELIAKHLHYLSNQSKQAFVSIDFSSIKDELQVERLFGDSSNTYGKWQQAKGGTLYLKEIAAMNAQVQEILMNQLQSKEVEQVRIISSSKENVFDITFHKDLYFRLTTLEIEIPPLRKRLEDLPELFDYFLTHSKQVYRKNELSASKETIRSLKNYDWPSNVRELKRAIERAVLVSDKEIKAEQILPFSSSPSTFKALKLDELEKQHIALILDKHNGNIQQSAAQLGISRAALYRRIEKYSLTS